MRLFQAALESRQPLFCQSLSSRFALHGLHALKSPAPLTKRLFLKTLPLFLRALPPFLRTHPLFLRASIHLPDSHRVSLSLSLGLGHPKQDFLLERLPNPRGPKIEKSKSGDAILKKSLWTDAGYSRTFREIWEPLVHVNFRGNLYGPIPWCLVFREICMDQ